MKNAISFLILALGVTMPMFAQAEIIAKDATKRVIERVFSEAEKAVIEEYFGHKHDPKYKKEPRGKKSRKSMPPGLAKKDKLPPGLQMQLEKNGRLPPGLARNTFPVKLENKLYAPRKGTKRLIVGDDVVLIDTATDIVLDILRGVARSQRN